MKVSDEELTPAELLLQLGEAVLEAKHREGYVRSPVREGEFDLWEEEQVWVD